MTKYEKYDFQMMTLKVASQRDTIDYQGISATRVKHFILDKSVCNYDINMPLVLSVSEHG